MYSNLNVPSDRTNSGTKAFKYAAPRGPKLWFMVIDKNQPTRKNVKVSVRGQTGRQTQLFL